MEGSLALAGAIARDCEAQERASRRHDAEVHQIGGEVVNVELMYGTFRGGREKEGAGSCLEAQEAQRVDGESFNIITFSSDLVTMCAFPSGEISRPR